MPELFECTPGTGPGTNGETACPICLEEISPDTQTLTHTLCNNTFCREHLEKWAEQQPLGELATCPMDRQIIGVGERDEDEDEGDQAIEGFDDDDNDDAEDQRQRALELLFANLLASTEAPGQEGREADPEAQPARRNTE